MARAHSIIAPSILSADFTRLGAEVDAVLTIGSIHGGIRNNIIPDDVKMLGTLRTFDDGQRRRIVDDMRNVIESVAHAHGAKGRLDIGEGSPSSKTYHGELHASNISPTHS